MKTKEIIAKLIEADLWKYCQVLFKRAETLNKDYRVYTLIRKKYPVRKYGYLRKALQDREITAIIGYDKFGALKWSLDEIYWVIQEMEREVYA